MVVKCFHRPDCQRDSSWPKSGPPQTQEEFENATEFILGHFTSSSFLDSILKHGLIPDTRKERCVDDRVPSDNESVYLTARYDQLYSERAVKAHGGKPILVEVKVDRNSIYADESALTSGTLANSTPTDALYLSLCYGACKHYGSIPLSDILSISELDGTIIYEKSSLRGSATENKSTRMKSQSNHFTLK